MGWEGVLMWEGWQVEGCQVTTPTPMQQPPMPIRDDKATGPLMPKNMNGSTPQPF